MFGKLIQDVVEAGSGLKRRAVQTGDSRTAVQTSDSRTATPELCLLSCSLSLLAMQLKTDPTNEWLFMRPPGVRVVSDS